MIEHHIQKQIVYMLSRSKGLRFSELKPDTIENKLFDYHLKKVVHSGLVEKNADGQYILTAKGRRIGKNALKQSDFLIDRVYSVLFLVIQRESDGAWLMCRRKTHPLFDKVGFMHAVPELNTHAVELASRTVREKVGLDTSLSVRGNGFLRMYEGDSLESFTHFTLLAGVTNNETLLQNDEFAEYFWAHQDQLTGPDTLPSILDFLLLLQKPDLFYYEQDFTQ